MYSLSQTVKDLFQSTPWGVEMTITPITGDQMTVTDANIVMGTLTVDRYVSTSEALPVGTATAGQLSFTLDNHASDFDGVVFAGAEIYARFYVWNGGNKAYLPIGYFTIDEAPRILETVSITALDRMVQYDFVPNASDLIFPCHVYELVRTLSEQALGGDAENCIYNNSGLPSLANANYQIPAAPDGIEEFTARQLLQFCCQIMGCNAQINRGNQLYLSTYNTTSLLSFDETQRYSSDIREQTSVTGISVTNAAGDTNLSGDEGYVLEIKDNPLIQTDPADIDLSGLIGITFCPFSAVTVPMPWMFPMDFVTFTKEQVGYPVYITKMTQSFNGNTAFEGAGLSSVQKGYATIDPLTVREQQILRDIRTRASEAVSAAEQNAISFSNIIANSLGLYDLSVTNPDGSTTFYFGDQETLEDSNVIYTFRANGFAWTSNWNGGSPTWENGIDANGNAILRLLTLYKLTAAQIEAGSITANEINLSVNDAIFGAQSVNDVIDANGTVTGAAAQAGANKATLDSQKDYIRIGSLPGGGYGVAIGTVNNGNFVTGAKFVKNRLSFYDNSGNEVAWISDATLHINEAQIVESIKFGYGYKWVINSDSSDTDSITGYGSVVLRW